MIFLLQKTIEFSVCGEGPRVSFSMIAVSSVTQARLFLNEKSKFCRKSVCGRRTTGLSRDAHGAPPGMKKKSAAYPLPKQNGEDMRMFLRFALRKKRGKREAAKPRFLVLRRRTLTVGAALLAAAAIFGAVNAPAAVRASAATRQLPIYCVERDQKVCSISFDAAWGADNTQKILDVLADYGVKCTFFVVGNWADQYPEQAKAIVESGNELMNHSNAHDHYNSLTADQIIADVNTCSDKIEALTGVRPTLIRCPFGEYDDHVISAIRSIGMEPIQWDVERYHIA
jgi:hypothetical protein